MHRDTQASEFLAVLKKIIPMSQLTDLTIEIQSETVVLRTSRLLRSRPWPDVRELIGRLLAPDSVHSIEIDRKYGKAILTLRAADAGALAADDRAQKLQAVAEGLRHPSSARNLLSVAYGKLDLLHLSKGSAGVTAGSVTSHVPGRVRLRHPLLRGHAGLARRVQFEFSSIPDVVSVTASPLTGSVLVLFRTGKLTPHYLLMAMERVIVGEDEATDRVLAGPPISHWVAAGTCLGLAITSEFFIPGAAAVTAAALVASSLPTLGRGLVELCTFRWRVASLYTVIMGTTLVSGQFLAAALMQATVTAWHGWTTHRLRNSVRDLEASPEVVGRLIEPEDCPSDIQRIKLGSVVHVPVGAVLPFDGVVIRGEGDIDERGMRGNAVFSHCRPGDSVFAGSALLNGGLEVKVGAVAEKTRLSVVRRTVHSLICDAVGEGGATTQGKAVASRFVPLTFATGTAALLAGDITTLAAVLRPDFCTGPSLNDRLGTLTGVSHLLHQGWLVKKCESLNALANVQTIVHAHEVQELDGNPSNPAASPSVSCRQLPGDLGPIEIRDVRGTLEQCVRYIENLRADRNHVAVAAGHSVLSSLSGIDVVRISVTPDLCLDRDYADVVALHGSHDRLEDLVSIVQEAFRPGRSAWSVILTCNVLAISGAFLAGLTSLHVVVLTNIGALAAGVLYNRHVKRSDAMLSSHGMRTTASADDLFPAVEQEIPEPQVLGGVPVSDPLPKARDVKKTTSKRSKKNTQHESSRLELPATP